MKLDYQHWKIPRICKDKEDIKRCQERVRKYFPMLKHIFVVLTANTDFPCIGWYQFTQFIEKIQVIDRYCTMSIIDSIFIATNYEVEDMDENPDRALNRYEFLEFLVRLGAFKFKD